jgi:alkylresorcinol/alkylpyrone synthase
MTTPTLISLATGVPAHKYLQMEIHDRWLSPFISSQRARAIFAAAEIETRHSVLAEVDFLAGDPGTKARNDLFMQAARPLTETAICQALAQANLTPTDIDHFLVVSCTGFDTPGLVILAGDLHAPPTCDGTAIIGMGCQAGLTGLDRAILEVMARPQSHVLMLAVEFGTLHFQHGASLENMVADALFGDGLAAAVIGADSTGVGGLRLINTMTYSDYQSQDLMGFHLSDKGFQIHLATRVPKVLQRSFLLVDGFLSQSGLQRSDISFWASIPAGPKLSITWAKLWHSQPGTCATPPGAAPVWQHVFRHDLFCIRRDETAGPSAAGRLRPLTDFWARIND